MLGRRRRRDELEGQLERTTERLSRLDRLCTPWSGYLERDSAPLLIAKRHNDAHDNAQLDAQQIDIQLDARVGAQLGGE
jgi:hypothetical protein